MRMWECGNNIRHNLYGLYNMAIGLNLRKKVAKYAPLLKDHYSENHGVDLERALKEVRSVTDYDAAVTSIVFGYGTIENYY